MKTTSCAALVVQHCESCHEDTWYDYDMITLVDDDNDEAEVCCSVANALDALEAGMHAWGDALRKRNLPAKRPGIGVYKQAKGV